MRISRFAGAGVCLVFAAAAVAAATSAAVGQGCTSSQDNAVKCFVTDAVRTNLTSLRYGMTMTQFKSYGVAVSKVMQTQQTYLVLFGISSAIADAMPPTNADGSPNLAAQQAAVNSIVHSEVVRGLLTMPAEVSEQQLKWLSLDLVASMSATPDIMLSPGTLLRITDSNVVAATTNGVVNWTLANSNLASMVTSLSTAGLLKLPPSIPLSGVQAFTQDLAQAIYAYKTATGRATL